MMIYGLIPQELHEQLLDHKNYQNRTNGVEELKNILLELDLKPVPSDSILKFINLLRRLLDDSNFKVFYGTLQVINILVQKLDHSVDKYCKQIVFVALKTLGDTHTVTRNEYMNVFRQLMRIVGPQKVLDLVIGHLRHKNSRVREDVINIITAAMLTHPRKDFNIPSLCFEVAPYLADSKKKVRHAALELFAVFDSCLDTGNKQPLMKAIDRVELTGDVEGLMAAVQARRARHMLPRLTSEGLVEYALVIPKPGQRCLPQFGSGADLDWVLNGGRVSSARSLRTEPDTDRLCGYGSLGSLTDDFPLQRRIVSAGKGKNKLPWERASLPCPVNQPASSSSNGKSSDKVSHDDFLLSSVKRNQASSVAGFDPTDPLQKQSPCRRRERQGKLHRSGSLDLDPDVFKVAHPADSERVLPRPGCLLSGNPSVERTFSLPSSHTAPGSFLLPSYPLAVLPAVKLTPTLPRRRQTESSLSMSNTWPNKRDVSPHHRDPSPWRDTSGELSSSRCSLQPSRTSLVSSSSSSSLQHSLGMTKRSPPTSSEWAQTQESQRNGQQEHTSARNLHLDLSPVGLQDQEEEPVDREEMMNSLRSLRNSAAKKRAKASSSDVEPESPDSAVKLELALDSPSQTSPSVTSPLSESGLSSLCSPPTPTLNGPKTGLGNSAGKPRVARTPSGKQKTPIAVEPYAPQGRTRPSDVNPRDKAPSDVSVIGQRMAYPNGLAEPDEDKMKEGSPSLVRPAGREPLRVLRASKGSQVLNPKSSCASDMSEGVVGRGVFGSVPPSSSPGVSRSPEVNDTVTKLTCEPPAGVYGHAVSARHPDPADDTTDAEGTVVSTRLFIHEERVKLSKFAQEKMWQHCLEQQDVLSFHAEAQSAEKTREPPKRGASDPSTEEPVVSLKETQINGSAPVTTRLGGVPDGSPVSPTNPPVSQSPVKCFSPPLQPSPPTVPPPKATLPRLRRAPSLNRTRPSLSLSSDELSPGTPVLRRDPLEQAELRPFSRPELALSQALRLLSLEDWEKKIEGMTFLRSLVQYHSDVLSSRLHDVCLVLLQEVKNLRSSVSRVAVVTVRELYAGLQKGMDQELEGTARVLLHKAGESNAFIRQDVDAALDSMVQNCTPSRTMNALIAGGLGHLNSGVRKCMAQHLTALVEKVGAGRLLSGAKDLTDRILPAVSKLAQDSSQEARYYGRRMLLFLSSHRDFDKMLEKYVAAKDLTAIRDTLLTLKTKGLGEMPQDTPSARGRRSLPGSGTVRASSLTREPLLASSRDSGQYSSKAQAQSIADKTEYIKQLTALLNSKDFRERIRGIDQLVSDSQENPYMVTGAMFPVFDAFKARLQESNSKVNLYALESLPKIVMLLRDSMAPVVNMLVPAIVENHLNSKNNAIYTAAIGAIHALLKNVDNTLLLQPFCTKAQFLSGKAKVDLIDKVADLVRELYPRKPQAVEQKVLPLLWHLLGTTTKSGTIHGRVGSVRAATANLCQALYEHMGESLLDCTSSQPINIHKNLNELLKSLSAP
ncbi:TOG array regulator of axonemal microtubules protein 1 [Chanos chanos]|uniref:TOG array regulator of axonemal microtubules protein 1 n=1 Tax=Chanos chanos TaxID=29144 RepID=A0A6J2WAN7_CHACN|nr:TOG array regulator of axonemal microtubules protein 1 [Chanos chanos]